MNRWITLGLPTAAVAVLVLSVIVPTVGRVSNCGGNSAALSNCRSYAQGVVISSYEESSSIFNISSTPLKDLMIKIAVDTAWIGDGEYYMRVGDIVVGKEEETVVIVCNRPFTNVPQRMWRSNPPMHAAGLANGTAVLLSEDEFKELDMKNFVSARRLKAEHDGGITNRGSQ